MTLSTAASKGLTKPSLFFVSFTPWMLLANWWVGITSHLLWAAKRLHTYVVFDFLGFRIPSFQHPSDCAEMTRCGEESDALLTHAQIGVIFQDQLKQLLASAGKGKPLWEGAGEQQYSQGILRVSVERSEEGLQYPIPCACRGNAAWSAAPAWTDVWWVSVLVMSLSLCINYCTTNSNYGTGKEQTTVLR